MSCVGSVPLDLALEEEDGVELEEEEELESVAVSETEFNFLDFIKRCVERIIYT